MIRILLAAAMLAAGVDVVRGMDGQPLQQLVQVDSNGGVTLVAQYQVAVCRPVQKAVEQKVPTTKIEKRIINGQEVDVPTTVYETQMTTVTQIITTYETRVVSRTVELDSTKAFEVDGRPIAPADLAKRLTDGTLVVVSATDGMLPEYQAKVFKAGTVILARPSVPMMMPAPAAPPAAPAVGAGQHDPAVVRPVAYGPASPVASIEALFPKSPAPWIVTAARDGKNDLAIRQLVETPAFTELFINASDSGEPRQYVIKAQQLTRHSETTVVPLSAVRFSSSAARDIAADQAAARLSSNETSVLVSMDGKLVDDFWLQNIRPEVLVLRGVKLPPVSVYGGGMLPPPMAYPAMPMPVAPAAPPAPAPVAAPRET